MITFSLKVGHWNDFLKFFMCIDQEHENVSNMSFSSDWNI